MNESNTVLFRELFTFYIIEIRDYEYCLVVEFALLRLYRHSILFESHTFLVRESTGNLKFF